MVDSKKYIDWVTKAEQDLKGAKILLEHHGGNDLVAFHCQQAVEKILKAYMLFIDNRLVDGHSLIYLNKECRKYNPEFSGIASDVRDLNTYYIETRYPADAAVPITNKEAKESVEAADKILKFVKKLIS